MRDVEKSEILHIWHVCDVENFAIYAIFMQFSFLLSEGLEEMNNLVFIVSQKPRSRHLFANGSPPSPLSSKNSRGVLADCHAVFFQDL